MTTHDGGLPPTGRDQILQAGRHAAVSRSRADSQRCRDRVMSVIETMRRSRTLLSDAEITRQAQVNPQFLQRHRDLKAHAAKARAELQGDKARAEAATQSEREAALVIENRMLIEQNDELRRDLEVVRAELRALRVEELASSATGALASWIPGTDGTVERLRQERDQAHTALRTAEADLAALRNLNQRLMIENSRLIEERSPAPE